MKNGIELTVTIPIRDRDGRQVGTKVVATYAGLLAKAHEEGLRSITTELVQVPSKENGGMAIVRAVATTNRGQFSGLGDASPANVNSRVAVHLLRVAETRAKGRALRDALNVGMLALEELAELGDDEAVDEPEAEPQPRPGLRSSNGNGSGHGHPSFAAMSEPQRRMLFRLATGHGVPPDKVNGWLCGQLGVESLKAISKIDASKLIEHLQADVRGREEHAS